MLNFYSYFTKFICYNEKITKINFIQINKVSLIQNY